jgi:hypothetical protein
VYEWKKKNSYKMLVRKLNKGLGANGGEYIYIYIYVWKWSNEMVGLCEHVSVPSLSFEISTIF